MQINVPEKVSNFKKKNNNTIAKKTSVIGIYNIDTTIYLTYYWCIFVYLCFD